MNEMPLGWLSPNGELFECNYYEHIATAEKIIDKLNISYNSFRYSGKDDALLSLGWCKLTLSSLGNKQYHVHWERPLTTYQRYFLKDFFDNEKELKFPMNPISLCKYLYEDEFFDNQTKDGAGE